MTTDQRAEALRLAKEAGLETNMWEEQTRIKLERLIALARASAAPQEPVAVALRDSLRCHTERVPCVACDCPMGAAAIAFDDALARASAAPQEPVGKVNVRADGRITLKCSSPEQLDRLEAMHGEPVYAAPQPQAAPSATSDDARHEYVDPLAFLDEQPFYEICQQYRHCPVDAALPYEALKAFIRNQIEGDIL